MKKYTVNNLLALTPYDRSQGLRPEINNGFMAPGQSAGIVGLTLLMDAKLKDGSVLKTGSKVYFSEKNLNNDVAAKEVKTINDGSKLKVQTLSLDLAVFVEEAE